MDNNSSHSHADELFKILNDLDSPENGDKKPENSESAGNMRENSQGNAENTSESDNSSETDELFEILNNKDSSDSGNKAKNGSFSSENAFVNAGENADNGTEHEDTGEENLPSALTNHLFDEGEAAKENEIAAGNSHFTEIQQPLQPENAKKGRKQKNKKKSKGNDDSENYEEPSKVKRVFSKISVIPKTVVYLAIVLIVSVYLAYFIISVANDIFAFVTDSRTVEVEISEGATDESVSKLLHEKGIIEHPKIFELYMKHHSGDEKTKYIPGTYEVNTDYNYSQIITLLTNKKIIREELRITIPEGFTVDQIIDLFVSKGLGEKEKYVEAINEYPYKHEFVRILDEKRHSENGYNKNRKYRLEGYLYPDTYDFYSDTDEVHVINRMLNNFNVKFWIGFTEENAKGESYQKMCKEKYGMDFDDIVVLASMIQAEGKTAVDFEYISYVFHNRLSHKDSFPYLESDATIQYILKKRVESSDIDISIDNPYNTYKYKGLPPGAISNAGLDALMASMFPSPPVNSRGKEINAYYFVSNNAGKTYYSVGLSGHNSNIEQVKKDNAAIEAGTYN